MRSLGRCLTALFMLSFGAGFGSAALAPPCSQSARTFLPCELAFDYQDSDLPPGDTPYRDDVLNVEFRSPQHMTFAFHAFWDGGHTQHVRFSPTEPGTWAYRVSSSIKRYDNQESTFVVADSANAGMVSVANLRHWRTTDKKPHLWFAAGVPFLSIDQTALETWLDQRKRDGFTHIRGTLLTLTATEKPFQSNGQPNLAYFSALDDRHLASANRGFTLDLLLADQSFLKSGAFSDHDKRDPICAT